MKKALLVALCAVPVLLLMSYPGREASSGPLYVISTVGWFGFVVAVLVVMLLSVALAVRKLTRPTAEGQSD